ncbi:hypothetical protein SAMN06269301_3487 [Geobacter sp. DSM 9736]|nr:hypothetical protein SAMN06269301_3487 [Geobacter sp. DSM 9736]
MALLHLVQDAFSKKNLLLPLDFKDIGRNSSFQLSAANPAIGDKPEPLFGAPSSPRRLYQLPQVLLPIPHSHRHDLLVPWRPCRLPRLLLDDKLNGFILTPRLSSYRYRT